MRICRELKFFTKDFLVDMICICIVGTLLHFLYEFSGGNLLVAMFSATNESIVEHIKIAVISTYIVAIVKMWIEEKRKYNLWSSLFFKFITQIIILTILFFSYQKIIQVENRLLDILIFYVSIILSEVVECMIEQKLKISAKVEDILKYINIFIIIIFIILTFIKF